MSDEHQHRYTMVKRGNLWLCTQGEHNRFEANGYRGFQAVVMCHHDGCSQGWCVDCIPDERTPGQTKGPR